METAGIIRMMCTDKAPVVQPEASMIVFADCAFKTTMHTQHHRDLNAIWERYQHDTYMNFANALFKITGADAEWQYQYLQFARASLCFDPGYMHQHLVDGESDAKIFKDDLLALMKLFFAFSDGNGDGDGDKVAALTKFGLREGDWKRLRAKYLIKKRDLVDLAWTYPYLAFVVCRLYAVERPVAMNMLADFPGFQPEMRLFGLLGIVPRFGKYGGFVKALLHHTVLQIAKGLSLKYKKDFPDDKLHLILRNLIGLGRVIYHSEVSEFLTRREFTKCLNISDEDMQTWTTVFDEKYPTFWDIHIRYFEQTQ